MTVANTLRRAGAFVGDGVTTAFPFAFKAFAAGDLVVTELDTATNIEVVKTLTTHYTVALNPDQDTSPGGTVTAVAALAVGKKWTLSSAVPAVQGSALSTGGGFYPEVIEAALDKLTILLQELQELKGRTLVTPISTPIGATLPPPEANKAIAWNGAADNLQNVTLGGAGAVSTFMEPVILAVDAADARTQLTAAKSGANSDITSLTALASINGGPLAGFRNRVINGNFGVNQGGYVSGAAVGADAYGHDMWKMAAPGDTYTFTTVNNVTTVTIPAGKVLRQVIEGLNLETGTYTLSWSGTAQGKIGAGAYGAPGVTGAIVGGTNTTIEFGPGTLSKVQLEIGSIATVFEQRPQGTEIDLCLRYYERISGAGAGGSIYAVAYALAGNGFTIPVYWKVTKRTNPTLVKAGTWTVTNCAQPTIGGAGVDSCFMQSIATATGQALFSTADSTTYISASARL
jgi:hypothetical protein